MGIFSGIGKFFKNILGDIIGFLIGVDFDDFDDDNKGTLLNSQSNVAPLPVIYGKRRIGGTRVFVATGPSTKTGGVDANTYLYVCLALCEGEIHLIRNDTGIYIDDELVVFTGTGATLTSASGTRIGTRIKMQRFYGRDDGKDASQTLTYSTLLAEHPDWTSAHQLKGVAYLALRFEYDQSVFRSIPTVNAEVFGRPLYDPFLEATTYSSNPALIVRDYLTNTRYGKGLPTSAIDDDSFIAAKNHLDLTVFEFDDSLTAVNVNPFGCRIDTSKTVFNNVKELLQGMRGLLPYREGKYSLLIDKSEAVDENTFELHPGNITSDIAVQQAGKKQRYNRVIAKFVNPEADYQLDTAMWPEKGDTDYDDYLEEDNDEELIKNITVNTLTRYSAVRDLCRVILLASRRNVNAVQLTATSEAMDVSVGDIVVLDHPTLGWTQEAKQNMRVVDTQITDDGEVKLSLIEYNSSIYQWQAAGAPPDNLNTNLPDMTEAPEPTNLTATETTIIDGDGKVVPSVDLSWTAADTAFVEEYHVQWKKDSQSIYVNESRTVNTQLDIFNLEFNPDDPVTYDFRVRTMNTAGVYSDFVETTEIINGDDTPPANVTDLSARGDFEGIVVQWTNPTDKDFSHTEIHSVTSNTEPAESADPTVSVMGEQFVEYDLEPETQKYYFARTVDRSGNKSDFSSAVTATATAIRIRNLGLLLNQNGYPTDLNVSEIKEGEEYEVLTLGTTSTFGWGGLGSQGTVGDVFTATRDGTKLDGTGTVEHTSYESNNGEFTLVGQRLSGEYRYGEDASIVWNGKQIDITSDNHDGFTGLTNLSGKQGWIGFDRNLTAPFDMSGTLPNINVGFVYYEDGQWYYDDDSVNPVSFNPDSFTGTTTGTDGTTTARIVAIGTLKTGSSADSIAEGGLFSDPLDLRTVELPENFVDVTKIATQLESDNYSQDSAGWKIERSGDVEFNNITARGEIHAESGTIASTVTIGGTEIGDIESMVNGSLALYINKDAGQTTANGEGALVGVARDGTPVNDSDGFIVWDGSKITIESDQLTSTASFATQVQNQRGFIVFDVNKSNPFDIYPSPLQSIDVAFAYKIDDQWYYDDNSTATATSGQTFDPEDTSGAEFVAIGWLETSSSDVIKYGGLYGQPVALTLAAFPSDALESGTIGGISISNDKLYEGVGTFKDANTGFYLDSGGDFSLKDKLSFDNSAGELIVDGTVRADVIDIVDGDLYGDIEASSVAPGQVGIDQVSEAVYNEIKRRFINSKDGFYFTDTESIDGSSVYTYITTGDLGNSALTTESIELEAVFTYRFSSTTNYSATNRDFFALFEWSSNGTSWNTVSVETSVRHTVTQTQTEFGYVYELNVVQRETVTLPSNYGYLRLSVQLIGTGSNSIWAEHPLAVSFVADQAGLIIGSAATTGEAQFPDGIIVSGITYPDADGTNGQVITTDGSGNLSFSTVSGGGGGDADTLDGLNSTQFLRSDESDTFSGTLTGDVIELSGGVTFDPSGGGTGTDTATDVGIALSPGTRIVGTHSGYIRSLLEWNASSDITIGQGSTSLIQGINLLAGSSGDVKVDGNRVLTVADEGAGNGLDADTVDGYHAAQTAGDWFGHIPKVDSNGNMEIGRFTDWHYTDTSTASYDARSEITNTGVLRHTTAYGYIDLGPNNSSYAHITTDRSRFYFNKKLIVNEGIINSYDEDLQLAAGSGQAASIIIDYPSNEVTFNENLNFASGARINHNTDGSRDKIRVWGDTSAYAIGMDNAMLYGHLGDYAMTFQMNSDADRGWVFLDSGHSDSQGAMSLTTEGKMTLATSLSVGEGESITSPQSDVLYVKGNPNFAVMPTFETPGKIIISRGDNTNREHEMRFDNSSLPSDNYMKFAVHNGTVGSMTEVLGLFGDNRAQIFGAAVVGDTSALASSFNASANRLIVGDGAGNEGLTIFSGTTSYGSIHFADTATTGGGSYNGYINHNQNNATMTFGTNAAARMSINSTGDVRIITGDLIVSAGDLDLIGTIRIQEDAQTGYTHSRLITESNSTSRGSGHFMWTSPGATEWYMGRPYVVGDEWMVARRQGGTSHSDATADRQYALLTVKNSGRVGIGEKDPDSQLEVNAGSLGTTGGNSLPVLNLQFASSNLDRLTVTARRKSTGTDWQTAAHKIQRTVDVTDMGYIQFGKNGADDDLITFGKGSTEYMRIDGVGDVGINKTTPSAKFHVNGTARFDHSEHQGFRTQVTDSTANQAFYGHHLDINMSGSDTLTADRTHAGLYIDLDSSATGGDISNEHRVYGIYSDVRITGDSDLAYASYSLARSSHSSGTVTQLIGAQGYGFGNNSAGKTTNVYGAYNFGRSSVTGTGEIDNVYGSFNVAQSYQTSTDTGTVLTGSYNICQYTGSHNVNANQARGVYAEVQIDPNSNSWTLSNVYVVRAEFDNNDDENRTNNAYLFYGNYSGINPTNTYGVYIANDVKNFFRGTVAIGTSTSPQTNLEINTSNRLGSSFTGATDGEGLAVNQDSYADGNYVSLVEGSYLTAVRKPNVRIAAKYESTGSSLCFGTSNSYASGITNLAMQIDASGRVGVGEDNPQGMVDAKADSAYLPAFYARNDGSAASWARMDWYNDQVANTGIIYRDQAGNFTFRNDNSSGTAQTTTIMAGNTTAGNIEFRSSLTALAAKFDTSGNFYLGDGISSSQKFIRVWHNNDNLDVYGYGIQFNRTENYLRPTTDGNKSLYIGNDNASRDWNYIYFRSVNGLYMTGTQFLTSGRNLVNIGTVTASGAVNCQDVFASGYIDANGLIDGFMFRVQGNTVIDSSSQLQVGSSTADHNIQGNTYMGDSLQVRINSSSSTSIFEGGSTNYVLRHTGGVTMSFQLNGNTERYVMNTARLAPGADNTYALGNSTRRWSDVFSAGGVTTSSDERLKQQIRDIDEAERRVAVAAKGLLKAYKYNDAVEKKGDGARWHIGIIAQELKTAFKAEGLDAHDYGMFMYTEVWEAQEWIIDVDSEEGGWYTTKTWETEEEAPSHAVRKDEYAIRYQELLAFIIAAI